MLALLAPLAKRFVTVAAHTPRAMPAETLAEHIRARGCKAEAAPSIEAGVARAVALGGDGRCVHWEPSTSPATCARHLKICDSAIWLPC